jgi:hypothetical protein
MIGLLYLCMPNRIFVCSCRKCGIRFDFTGTYEEFSDFMDSESFACAGGHEERNSPRAYLQLLETSQPDPTEDWKPTEGRNYVDILDYQTARVNGMQIDHIGSGLYVDRKTGKKYDYEEDKKGNRHYFEVWA